MERRLNLALNYRMLKELVSEEREIFRNSQTLRVVALMLDPERTT